MFAGGADDYVDGGSDDDYIEGNSGSDTLFGGDGNDTIFGAGNDQHAYDADGDDYIDGGAGDDAIEGGGGSDTIYGGGGNDYINGKGGNIDLYITPDAGDYLYGEGGNDQIYGHDGDDRLDGGADIDTLYGGEGNDDLLGGTENDTLFGEKGDDYLNGESGDDQLQGGDGADLLYGDDGADVLFGEVGNDQLHGGDGVDELYGGEDDDTLHGDAGEDRLFGGIGQDELHGGLDDDNLQGGDGDDKLYGGDGIDALYGEAGDDTLDGGAGDDEIQGDLGDDLIIGGAGDDHLDGQADNDTYLLTLGAGHDVIADDKGINHLRFGEGIQQSDIWTAHVVSPNGMLYIALVYSEADTVYIKPVFADSGTVSFADGTSTTINEILKQVPGDYVEGLTLEDRLDGTSSDDRLLSYADSDMLYGWEGDDWLDGGDGNDLVSGGDGLDIVLGGGGVDQLFGGNGNDYLDGGSGGDILTGGAGDDTYAYSKESGDLIIREPDYYGGDDRLVMHGGVTPDDVIPWRKGDDLILSLFNGEEEIMVENFFLNSETGIDKVLFANGALWERDYFTDAILQQGIDTHAGSASDDTFHVDHTADSIEELPDGGIDTVISTARYTLPDNVENLTLGGNNHIAATGNNLDNYIVGNSGDNTLEGGGAATAAGDTLVGGTGDDTYIVREGDDVQIIEQPDEGIDTVICTDTDGCTLSENLENIEISQDITVPYGATVRLVGNDLDNVIRGHKTASNRIDGGAGADEMWGGTNNDVYVLDNPNDIIFDFGGVDQLFINPGYTADTVYSIDGLDFENVWINEGTTIEEVHGNGSSNSLYNADTIYGYGGNDTIFANQVAYGGDGNDSIHATIAYGGLGDDNIEANVAYYHQGDGRDYLMKSTHLMLDSSIALHQLDFKSDYSGYYIHMPDGGYVKLNDELNGLNQHRYLPHYVLQYGPDGKTLSGNDLLCRFRDTKIVGDNLANDITLSGISNIAYGLDGDDRIKSSDESDAHNTLIGGLGNDEIVGNNYDGVHHGETYFYGDEGDDRLVAGKGENYLFGGFGDDQLIAGGGLLNSMYGGQGNDEYLINKESSNASISDNVDDQNILRFGAGIFFDDIGFELLSGNLTMTPLNGSQVTIIDWENGHSINEFVFSDGVSISDQEIAALTGRLLRIDRGLIEDRTLTLFINEYNDPEVDAQFIPVQERWIEIGSGIVADDLNFERIGDDLSIRIDGESETLTVTNWFYGHDDRYKVPRLVFMDGSELLLDDVEQRVIYQGSDGNDLLQDYRGQDDQIYAGEGNDTLNGGLGDDQLFGESGIDGLNGGSGDDLLIGGAGGDTLTGGTGNDTYQVSDGDGHDVIDNRDGGINLLRVTGTLTLDRLSFLQDGVDLIVNIDDGTLQSLRVLDHFAGTGAEIDQVLSDDGSTLTAADITTLLPSDEPPVDGGTFDNEVTGDNADNQLSGTNGTDLIYGEGGADTLFGFFGNDRLIGGDGDDYLSGGNGSNDPGDGNDHLIGGAGSDTLFGEGGNDLLEGGLGNDQYYYKAGGGQETIDNTGGGTNGIFFLDVTSDRLTFHQDVNDLVILVDGDNQQQVRVLEHFTDAEHAIGYVQPNGGYAITASAIDSLLTPLDPVDDGGDTTPPPDNSGGGTVIEVPNSGLYDQSITGSAAGEQVVGGGGSDFMEALAGDDQLFGLSGNDALMGGEGADYLDGGAGDDLQFGEGGNDQLGGDAGNDGLRGGLGDDIYVYRPGSGADVIDNSDGGVDWLIFTDDLTEDRLIYYRSEDDLIVQIDNDSTQQVTVQNWYIDGPLAYIQPAGGYGISASQIESMATDITPAAKDLFNASVGTQIPALELEMVGIESTVQSSQDSFIHHEMFGLIAQAIKGFSGGWITARGRRNRQTVESFQSPQPTNGAGVETAYDFVMTNLEPVSVLFPDSHSTVQDEKARLPEICIKQIPTGELSEHTWEMNKSGSFLADLQLEHMVSAMAGFSRSGVNDAVFGRNGNHREEIVLSAGGVN
ncbi:MAG: hypothetical protein KZQ80_08290 [Candidatus Thiodiazotropha sp. (ex Monitilora ramsayi)]|nr:hypothetical protein [Candidatus Thiodiazotropha sp. (ex Monitilora ramsayi)]